MKEKRVIEMVKAFLKAGVDVIGDWERATRELRPGDLVYAAG